MASSFFFKLFFPQIHFFFNNFNIHFHTNALQCSGDACTNCPSGRYGSRMKESSNKCEGPCRNAPEGSTYCGCLAGKYGPTNEYDSSTSNRCVNCEVGRYNDVTTQTSCKLCSAGRYGDKIGLITNCLLYTSPSPRD